MTRKIRVLLVVPDPYRHDLLDRLGAFDVETITASSCREALAYSQERLDLVLSALTLEDGSWWTLRGALLPRNPTLRVVVCLPRVEAGVADLVERGADAVLSPPYRLDSVRRALAL